MSNGMGATRTSVRRHVSAMSLHVWVQSDVDVDWFVPRLRMADRSRSQRTTSATDRRRACRLRSLYHRTNGSGPMIRSRSTMSDPALSFSQTCQRCRREFRGYNPTLLGIGLCPDCAMRIVQEANAQLPEPTEDECADYALYIIEQMALAPRLSESVMTMLAALSYIHP